MFRMSKNGLINPFNSNIEKCKIYVLIKINWQTFSIVKTNYVMFELINT